MLPHQLIEHEVTSAASLDAATESLAKLLSSGLSVWEDGSLYYTKQLVGRVHGLKIEVYAREHPPPHFHVTGGGLNATFSLADGSHLEGAISGREEKLVLWWYSRSRTVLVRAWNESRPSDCPVGPLPE
jgi:hypothetical protein